MAAAKLSAVVMAGAMALALVIAPAMAQEKPPAPPHEPGLQDHPILDPPDDAPPPPPTRLRPAQQIIIQNQATVSTDPLPTPEELVDVEISPDVAAAVRRLDDPSYAAREEATAALVRHACDDLELYAALVRENLSAEAKQRLLVALRDRLLLRPRGALGIRRDVRWAAEVVVEAVFPGMPAEQMLRPGDKITALDGRVLLNWEELMRGVQRKRPGDPVNLAVDRIRIDEQGQPVRDEAGELIYDSVEVTLQLGSADDLDRFNEQGVAQPSAVRNERMQEAQIAAQRFGDRPKRLRMPQGWAQELLTGDAVDRFGEVDDDIYIVQILSQRKAVHDGIMQVTPMLRQHWSDQLRELQRMAQTEALSPEERAFRLQVYQRYRDLVAEIGMR